ncbi:MAG TPA: hypothetical protein VGB18_01225 [Candidatus Thermoplasmatota archaeon]
MVDEIEYGDAPLPIAYLYGLIAFMFVGSIAIGWAIAQMIAGA